MNRIYRNLLNSIIGLVLLLLSVEIFLRVYFGFCNAPLYECDSNFEYMLSANQEGYRFGHHFYINSYQQRSEEPDSSKKIVLGLGDSVIFGGMSVSNEETAPYIYHKLTGIQMLNISAGSWGPDNCAAYLLRYGTFSAQAMYLLVSSHDAYDNMDFEPVVGKYVNYPKENYKFAIVEFFDRYGVGRVKKTLTQRLDPDEEVCSEVDKRLDTLKPFNSGFQSLKRISETYNIPFIVCLHAERGELKKNKYNDQGQAIINWCRTNNVKLILDMEEGLTNDMFLDKIHLNAKGNKFQAELMAKYITL